MLGDNIPQETRWYVRFWIWFWYCDVTRLLIPLCGLHLVAVIPLMAFLGIDGEDRRTGAMVAYVLVLCWAMLDNDYSKLYRIGRDIDHRPLKQPDVPPGRATSV